MKKVIIAIALLISVAGIAQKDGKSSREASKNLTPEQMAALQTKKMALDLDLTEAQQSQIQVLNLENAKLKKAKMEERKAMKEDGDRKMPTAEEKFAMQNQRLDAQIAQKAKMKKILSQEQYAKWEKNSHHNARRGKGEGRDRHKKKGSK